MYVSKSKDKIRLTPLKPDMVLRGETQTVKNSQVVFALCGSSDPKKNKNSELYRK